MADSSVAITAGSGTPIRVLTGLGAGVADQQVITLADSAGNLLGTAAAPMPISVAGAGGLATVKGASTAVAATDLPLAVGFHPSSPLPAGASTIGAVGILSSTGGTGVFYTSTGTNAAQVAKAAAGNLQNLSISNSAASTQFVKIYNATSVTLGTTAAVMDIPVVTNGTVQLGMGGNGQRFATGICFAITGAAGATNNTANTAGVTVALTYV